MCPSSDRFVEKRRVEPRSADRWRSMVRVGRSWSRAVALRGRPVFRARRMGCPLARAAIRQAPPPNPSPRSCHREAYVPAQRPPPCQEARLPRPDEHPRRTGRAQVPPRQGPGSSLGLIDRFRTRSEFDRLRRSGVRVRAGSLRCTYLHDPGRRPTRVAFAVPRSAGSAVRRNRFRRRARAVLEECDLPPGWVLVRGDRPAVELSFPDLQAQIRRLVAEISRRALPPRSSTRSPVPNAGSSG